MNQAIPIESLKVLPNTHKKIIGTVGTQRFESDNIPINEPITVHSLMEHLAKKHIYLAITASLLVKDSNDNVIGIQEGVSDMNSLI